MKRGKRKEKGKIKDEMLKHFFEQEISMGSEAKKVITNVSRGSSPSPHLFLNFYMEIEYVSRRRARS